MSGNTAVLFFDNAWLVSLLADCLTWRELVSFCQVDRRVRTNINSEIGRTKRAAVLTDGKAELCFTRAYQRRCHDCHDDVRFDMFPWSNIGTAFKALYELLAPLREQPATDEWVPVDSLTSCMIRV